MEIYYNEENEIALTGIRSYVGKHIVAYSGAQWQVCESENLEKVVAIIHLAARPECHTLSALCENVNVDMYILNLAERHEAKIIYASGNNVFPYASRCTDDCPPVYNDKYSLTKFIGEHLLFASTLPHCSVRIGDVFGVNQRHGNFFKALQESIKSKKPAQQYGCGGKVRSYIYVKDIARLLLHLATHESPKIVNACYDTPIAIHTILEYLLFKKAISSIAYSEDRFDTSSFFDYRSMEATKIPSFSYSFDMLTALDDFVEECSNAK
jgi:nucleoside-diphosphate-sugar epimerase